MKYRHQWAYALSIMILASAFALGLTVIYWLAYPYNGFNVGDTPVPVEPPIVKSGSYVIMHVKYCRIPGEYTIKRKLISDKIAIDLPDLPSGNVEGGCGEADIPNLLPKVSNPGIYHIEYDTTIKVNPIRTIQVKFDTQEFELIAG